MVADAGVLPFADASFDTVMVMWISTDVDDFGQVLREAARVLRPAACWSATAYIRASTARTSSRTRTAAG